MAPRDLEEIQNGIADYLAETFGDDETQDELICVALMMTAAQCLKEAHAPQETYEYLAKVFLDSAKLKGEAQ